ncbi:MAG: peptide deformylase, partial [bacterium]
GIGLAAPQVGVHKRFFLFISDFKKLDNDEEAEIKVAINPQILEREGETIAYEGCLSYPEHVAHVKRAIKINVRYSDINMQKVEEEFNGLAARVFQHELDHLEGILFIDRMEPDTLKHVDELKEDEENEDDQIGGI